MSHDARISATTNLGGPPGTSASEEPMTGQNRDDNDPPWGWVVTFATFVLTFLSMIPMLGFGVLFSEFLLDLGTSSTLTSWIFNLAMCFSGVMTYLVGPLTDEFGWRKIAFVAGFVMGFGMIISAFATSASYLIFSFSFLTGINMMVILSVSFSIVSHYFVRWRVIANSLMSSGVCVSQMVMPPVITMLQEQFGFMGTTLITGALTLNCCVAAMVLHPVHWHRNDAYQANSDTRNKPSLTYSVKMHDSLKRIKSKVVQNLTVLKNPSAIMVSIMLAIGVSVCPKIFSMVPFAMVESGFSQRESSLCLSVAGGCNLVARIMTSLLPCFPRISALAVAITGTILMAIMVAVFSVSPTLVWRAVTLGLGGIGYGLIFALTGVIIVEELGLPLLQPLISLTFLLSGVLTVVFSLLEEVVREVSGSYVTSLCLCGVFLVLEAVLGLLVPLAHKLQQRKEYLHI